MAFPLALIGALAGCALVQGILGPGTPEGMPAGTIRLLGAHGKAAGIAMADVLGKLEAEYAAAQQEPDASPDPVVECFLRPEAYDVYVGFQDNKYLVRVVAVDERCLQPPARLIHGGGYYEIDASTFVVLRRATGEQMPPSAPMPAAPAPMPAMGDGGEGGLPGMTPSAAVDGGS